MTAELVPDPDFASEGAVVYQIYPRSFQDSDGDGVGDLRGVLARVDHLAELGVHAVWLSPFYPSPLADGGYDISDHTGVDPRLGTPADVRALADALHARGMALLLDLVPCHTSIEHPWFREHPERYVWADAPPNNWRAAFGGPAWSRDGRTGRWYLHSFFPEQPDLDWRRPDVVEAMQGVVRFWLGEGVDGFRVDALDRIAKHPDLIDDPSRTAPFPFPQPPDVAALDQRNSSHWVAGLAEPLEALRSAAGGRFLVGEVYRPTAELGPYLEHLDSAFVFELMFAPWRADAVAAVVERGARLARPSWMLSNHDFSRIGSRIGAHQQRAAAVLLLTLPGTAFIYQGDEIGMLDGPGGDPPEDRHGRDRARHPMQWSADPAGGFTTGTPWLPASDPSMRSVAGQRGDPASVLELYRALIRLRSTLKGGLETVTADPGGLLVYRRGDATVALNLGDGERRADVPGRVVVATAPGVDPARLGPGQGVVACAPG
ncbi:MAG TPA: alpha-amylase family glycosyl hydrolase [Gaiellales bacterium]|nr:alpha-amylase family glycosyl hydrolase [Gaiellales bacterium]